MRPLYGQLDHALEQWKETLQEVEQVGGAFWAVHEFQHVPGVGPIAAHVFSAVIEEPSRFATKFKLWKYSQLGDHRSHQRQQTARLSAPGARGNAELKNLSHHAWRGACKSTTGPNAIKSFYQQSRLRTGSVRHARLNTQRKILEALWPLVCFNCLGEGRLQSRWLPSRLIPHRHRPRAELQPAHELQVDRLR